MPVQLSLDKEEKELTVLVHAPGAQVAVPAAAKVVRHPHAETAESARNIFVLVMATELQAVAKFVSAANRHHHLRALFVQENVGAGWLPALFERAGLRTLRNTLVHGNSDWTLPTRVLRAWAHGAQDKLIADATATDKRLLVTSCALELVEVPFDKIPALRTVPASERETFEIDEDGSYLHWPGPDVHLDLDSLRVVVDPSARKRAFDAKVTQNRRYGKAIAQLRTEKGIKQSEIAGLSERQVRRIERGESSGYESLSRMAGAHKMSLDQYLNELARIAGNRTDVPSGR